MQIVREIEPRVALLDAAGERLTVPELRSRVQACAPAGATVSRSYCHPYALVAWHDGPVGVDIERVVDCDERFARSILTPAERERVPHGSDQEVISLWSGKEALAKALGDALDYDPRRLDAPAGWPGGVSGVWRAATLRLPDGYCGWVCWRAS